MLLPAVIVIGTANRGKFTDWEALLTPQHVTAMFVSSMPEVPETEADLVENARRKAVAAAMSTGVPAVADDIGVFIHALGGGPGAMLKRWAVGLGGWRQAQVRASELAGSEAVYRCAVSLAFPDGTSTEALGEVRGHLIAAATTGPGLEPCFLPDGAQGVLSNLGADEQTFHHRLRALHELMRTLDRGQAEPR